MFGKPAHLKNYDALPQAFRLLNWKYEELPKDMVVRSVIQGDDLPIAVIVKMDEGFATFRCKLAFEAESPQQKEIVWELNKINDQLQFGSFRLDPESGWLAFHYSQVFGENRLDPDLIAAVLKMVVDTVDAHDGALKNILDTNEKAFRDVMFL